MGQFSKVLLAINKAHKVPHRALDCGPGLSHKKDTFACMCIYFQNNVLINIMQNIKSHT